MTNSQKFIYMILVTTLLTSCWQNISSTQNQVESQNNNSTAETLNSSDNSWKSDTSIEQKQTEEKLQISAKCIWCGHCVRIAVNNFKMNLSTHKAEVISQENIDSHNIFRAMKRCPVWAISIG